MISQCNPLSRWLIVPVRYTLAYTRLVVWLRFAWECFPMGRTMDFLFDIHSRADSTIELSQFNTHLRFMVYNLYCTNQ